MAKTYRHLYCACFSLLLVGGAGILAYVDIFQPGAFALLSAASIPVVLFTVVQGRAVRLYKAVEPYFADIVRYLDRHAGQTIGISVIIALVAAAGGVFMFHSFFDKLRYVGAIRETVASQIKATAPVPDPKLLAEAFRLYPARPEAPLLLIRTGRVFAHSDNWPKFVAYQGIFLEELKDLLQGSTLCAVSADGFDPVVFIAVINVEASVGATDPSQKRADLEEASKASIALLDRCQSTPERAIVALLLKDTANDVAPDLYDIDAASDEVAARIDGLAPAAAAQMARTHAYQQYLDFLAYRAINALHADHEEQDPAKKLPQDQVDALSASVLRHYRTLLSLRSVVGSSGEVLWFTTPGKLNLNRLFMARGGFSNSVNAAFARKVAELPELSKQIDALIDAPAFKSFQTPAAWFKATPLDLSLEGSKLKALTDATLKEGW